MCIIAAESRAQSRHCRQPTACISASTWIASDVKSLFSSDKSERCFVQIVVGQRVIANKFTLTQSLQEYVYLRFYLETISCCLYTIQYFSFICDISFPCYKKNIKVTRFINFIIWHNVYNILWFIGQKQFLLIINFNTFNITWKG